VKQATTPALAPPAILDGSGEPPPEQIEMRAGPLSLIYESGDLRYIRLGEREILRRVYVAVRDQNWGTIPARLTQVAITQGEHTFAISYHAEHQHGPLDFAWDGMITGAADGTIRFTMEGAARSTFLRNRIGFCVLHPMRECAGAPCVVEHADGTLEESHFPDAIAPHQPFLAMRAIRHEVSPGVSAEVRMTGDLFEMEDQRNWTDASFKTYSTPLALPFPVEVPADTRIAQSVTLSIMGDGARAIEALQPDASLLFAPDPTQPRMPLPRIGLGRASHGQLLTDRELAWLRALRLAHLRVDLDLAGGAYAPTLQRAVAESQALGAALEVALFCSGAAAAELGELAALFATLDASVGAWLIFQHGQKVTPPELVQEARRALGAYAPSAIFAGGTNVYFTELNRGRPELDDNSGVCYSLNPQVHAFDNASLTETLEAQAATVASARRMYGARPILVSPVTLRPRFNPNATGLVPEPLPGELPPPVDPRQMSLYGAGWTLGSLKHLAEAGATSVTYYETTGWRGVIETEAGPPLPERFRSRASAAFPLYHVLADLGEYQGGAVVASRSSQPLALDGIVLEQGVRRCTIVANLCHVPQRVRVTVGTAAVWVRMLDQATALAASEDPEAFRGLPSTQHLTPDGALELELPPYAIARIEETG
jgi:D-apionolactonase